MASSIAGFSRATTVATFNCRHCARWTDFEQPPCADGHGPDCPEWYCTECGAASIVGWSVLRRERRRQRRAQVGTAHVA